MRSELSTVASVNSKNGAIFKLLGIAYANGERLGAHSRVAEKDGIRMRASM